MMQSRKQRRARRRYVRFWVHHGYSKRPRWLTYKTIERLWRAVWIARGIYWNGEIGLIESMRLIETNHAK